MEHDFGARSTGTLDWLWSLPRRLAGGSPPSARVIPDQAPLLLDEPGAPSFHRTAEPEPAPDDTPRPLSMGAMATQLKPISMRRDSI